MDGSDNHIKGRGAQQNPGNRFRANHYVKDHPEGIDTYENGSNQTTVLYENPKKIVNKVDSPDLKFEYSVNPYQGCEHGCIYCYARNTHEFWGFSAGLDFERKIIVKLEAAKLLEKTFLNRNWKPKPIMFSGNTDCYQPMEKNYRLTRKMLEIANKYQNPVGIVTKNRLILRDLDILQELAKYNLVKVNLSITTLDEKLKQKMEPRTSSSINRIKTIEDLTNAGIPVGLMMAPIIPGINNYEIPKILKLCANAGALDANMTMVRLNGVIPQLFKQWLKENMPERMDKVWRQIQSVHNGSVSDSQWGRRITGNGPIAEAIQLLFKKQKELHFGSKKFPEYNLSRFRRNGNLNLFND